MNHTPLPRRCSVSLPLYKSACESQLSPLFIEQLPYQPYVRQTFNTMAFSMVNLCGYLFVNNTLHIIVNFIINYSFIVPFWCVPPQIEFCFCSQPVNNLNYKNHTRNCAMIWPPKMKYK